MATSAQSRVFRDDDCMLQAMGGSRMTSFGASKGYNIVQRKRIVGLSMKVDQLTWKLTALVNQRGSAAGLASVTEAHKEYQLSFMYKSTKYRIYFKDLAMARLFHKAVKKGDWHPKPLVRLHRC